MNNRERETRRWWRQADRDLESGRITARHDRHEVVCFLSQQSSELRAEAKRVDAVYVLTRYPNGLSGELTPGDFFDATDSEAALAASAKILTVVRNRLSEAVTSVPE